MQELTVSRLGFTGSRYGMTAKQKAVFESIINDVRPEWFHHGDCVGADAEAHDIASKVCKVVIHPALSKWSSLKAYKVGDETRPAQDHLRRNREIVGEVEMLIATPNTFLEIKRSGTWYTVRYARKQRVLVKVILPDGRVE